MTPFAEDVRDALDGKSPELFEGITFFDFNPRSQELLTRAAIILQGTKNELTESLPEGRYWLETSVLDGTKRVAFVVTSNADLMMAYMIHQGGDGVIGQHPAPIVVHPAQEVATLHFVGDSELEGSTALQLLAIFAAVLEAAAIRVKETVH